MCVRECVSVCLAIELQRCRVCVPVCLFMNIVVQYVASLVCGAATISPTISLIILIIE